MGGRKVIYCSLEFWCYVKTGCGVEQGVMLPWKLEWELYSKSESNVVNSEIKRPKNLQMTHVNSSAWAQTPGQHSYI